MREKRLPTSLRSSWRQATPGVLAHALLFLAAAVMMLAGWWWAGQKDDAPLGEQRQVLTSNPKAGVHTRLENEVEPWKIKRTLEMVRELGTPWVVEYFPWAFSERKPGQYSFNHADTVVSHANRQGLTVIARLGLVPEWARPEDSIPTYLDTEYQSAFADYAATFADHFRDQVNYLIIWNEPNLSLEWGYRPPDPRAYTQLLCESAAAIRSVNPTMTILAGALAPTLGDPEGDLAISDLTFLQSMYDYGAADCFDALAVHAYGLTYPAEDPPTPEVINFRRVELLHDIMAANGDGEKKIHITEAGWNDHPRWTRAVRPAQRIQNTIKAYQLAQEWPWLESISMWAFRYPWPERNVRDYYTFVTPDFQPKPIYLEVQNALGALP